MASTAYGVDQLQEPQKVAYFPSKMKNIDQNDHDDHDYNNNNNNNYRVRARTRERDVLFEERMQAVKDAYLDVFGREMPRFVLREIEDMTSEQIELHMIRAVIEYTACAPRPSWNYARTVIYRNRAIGICTERAFREKLYNRGREVSISEKEYIEDDFI